jgi:hypothetical protein
MVSDTRTQTRNAEESLTGMTDRLAEAYFHWLVEQIREESRHPAKTYWDLLRQMHGKEFLWDVPWDDNRLADGLELRRTFFDERNFPGEIVDTDDFGPCSVLEVLIGVSRKLAFFDGGEPEAWAWQLLVNLGLDKMPDPLSKRKARKVDEILERLIWRTYEPDGTGGFFPLNRPTMDQTKIEIWYQMASYIGEIHPEY